jgi:uncharacterized protein
MKEGKFKVIILSKGDNFKEALKKKLIEHEIESAFFYGIGGFQEAELAVFDPDRKEFEKRKFKGNQLEILSITGDVSKNKAEETIIHCHAVLSGSNFRAFGGHLVEATVGATCEIMLQPLEHQLTRVFDQNVGIDIIEEDGSGK